MDWKQIADRANQVVNQRGGAQSVKEDACKLKEIIQGQGTTEDKLKRAMEALRDPGADHERGATDAGASPVRDGGEGSGENTN
jgi:hypothetical protein